MSTLREQCESFVYDFFEKFSKLVAEGGEETEFRGIKVLQEKENFVRGTIINATALLYIHYVKEKNEKAAEVLNRLCTFIESATSRPCKTWGKLSMLRGLVALYDNNLINSIPAELLEKCKISSDYSDFIDKNTLAVINLPSNYLQVALACAALREKMGFESDGYAKKIMNKLSDLMKNSPDGWMDESPPYNRYDRYSFLVSSELSDTLMTAGLPFSTQFSKNLRLAVTACLFMANNNGDGWNYGRSLSCHGDCAIAEILSSGISRNLLTDDEKHLALAYASRIINKTLTFWYDKNRGSFNIWWDGRSTNGYRQVQRVMQVGLDMGIHMLSTLKNFEMGGLADVEPDYSLIKRPDSWESYVIPFFDDGTYISKAVIFRRHDTLAMLPLTGLGPHVANSAYMPYPAICKNIESAPEGPMPFLIPEYKKDGKRYRPCQYFNNITLNHTPDSITVVANGTLADVNQKMPIDTGIPFTITYTFDNNSINVVFNVNGDFDSMKMVVGMHQGGYNISAHGFDTEETVFTAPDCKLYENFNINIATEDERYTYKYMTPHGFIDRAIEYSSNTINDVSYSVIF